LGGALVARVGRVVMVVGGGPDNAGGRGFVRGGGPIPSLRVPSAFTAEIFGPSGRDGRPVPASEMVGSLDGCVVSWSSSASMRILRLRDVVVGREEENEAGIVLSRIQYQTRCLVASRRGSRYGASVT
jgi:hypothetical protein